MNIAIIGSGGREHALCQKFSESKKINKIFCITWKCWNKHYCYKFRDKSS